MSPSDESAHVDAELLALHALGEDVGPELEQHLAECPECLSTLEQLRATVSVGRSSLADDQLAQPAPRVWDAVHNELGLSIAPASSRAAVNRLDRNHGGDEVIPELSEADDDDTPGPWRRRRYGVRLVAIGLAASLIIALTIGGVATLTFGRNTPAVVASATLDSFPGWEGASGEAVLERAVTGGRQVRVTVDGASSGDGYREVWLISSDLTALVSLGVLEGSSGVFTVPDGVSIREYDLVDVSEEQLDGDPTHSGDSIVRGPLMPTT